MNNLNSRIENLVQKILGENEEQEMLVKPMDHSEAVGSEPVTDEPEVIDHSTGKVVKISDRKLSMTEGNLRALVRESIERALRLHR